MRFYELRSVEPPRFTGEYRASRKWTLPGVHCPLCDASWSIGSEAYPCVDLSGLKERAQYEEARLEEDFTEFERLRERVRPLVPAGMPLRPGASFGPLVGSAWGNFGQLVIQNDWTLLIEREAFTRLQAEGLLGLSGCRAELRFRQKRAPELLELQIEPRGRLHLDCLPLDRRPPCEKCGRAGLSLPRERVLDASTLPEDRDLFRLTDFGTVIIATERFADTVRWLGFEEVRFQEVPTR